jgi:hypothetical protein
LILSNSLLFSVSIDQEDKLLWPIVLGLIEKHIYNAITLDDEFLKSLATKCISIFMLMNRKNCQDFLVIISEIVKRIDQR